jgi:hypothetical protein
MTDAEPPLVSSRLAVVLQAQAGSVSGWHASGVRRLGEVGLGDAVGVAGRPLDQFDAITVGVGDPAGPRSVGVVRVGRRIGRDAVDGEIGEGGIQ